MNLVILDFVEPAQQYIIGYSQKKTGPVREAKFSSAIEALKTVDGLFRSDETIRYIKAPWGGEIGEGELKMLAEKESDQRL